METVIKRIKEQNAGVMVENVIVLPFLFIIIYFMIFSAFMVHDMCAVEAAAQRGIVYGSLCVSECNYNNIFGEDGELDVPAEGEPSFTSFKTAINVFSGNNVESIVEKETREILKKSRIPWKKDDSVTVKCDQKNHFFYQELTLTVTAEYNVPKFFALFGLETNYEYSSTASTRTSNPDEFIRNADLVVDIIADVDAATGGNINKITSKIGELADKLIKWLNK